MYVTVVTPGLNEAPGRCVDVKLSNVQLSEAVGAIQLTATAHAFEGELTLILAGQPEITGGSVSTCAGAQHIGPPSLLSAATTVKLPSASPMDVLQLVSNSASGDPSTVSSISPPSNFPSGRVPDRMNVAPGLTRPEKSSPELSEAVTVPATLPSKRSVRSVSPPWQAPQVEGAGQSHDWAKTSAGDHPKRHSIISVPVRRRKRKPTLANLHHVCMYKKMPAGTLNNLIGASYRFPPVDCWRTYASRQRRQTIMGRVCLGKGGKRNTEVSGFFTAPIEASGQAPAQSPDIGSADGECASQRFPQPPRLLRSLGAGAGEHVLSHDCHRGRLRASYEMQN